MCKYVIICGGVISSTGKGCAAASINLLMKMRGIKTEMIKFEPYRNLTASTLSPQEHGNVVVLDDGQECDLDMTHYESLGQANLTARNIITSGQIYKELTDDEVNGKWLGETIQDLHVIAKIKEKLLDLGKDVDLVICEIGGVVSDNESWVFYNALRSLRQDLGIDNVLIIHVSYIMYLNVVDEFKTKPLQMGINSLRSFGLDVDILLCRSEKAVPDKILEKINKTTGVPKESIFSCPDVETIYQIPIHFYNLHIDDLIAEKFRFRRTSVRIHKYRDLVEKYIATDSSSAINIAIVGKYVATKDSYFTVKEAVTHAAVAHNTKVNIKWIDSEELESTDKIDSYFKDVDGIILPGGFASRGIEGKILTAQYAREKGIPFLGICLGLQCAVIEFARNVCKMKHANSLEFDPKTSFPVIHYVEGQEEIKRKSGTMRLGAYDCELKKGSVVYELYGKKSISERHRHRYEVNAKYVPDLEKGGFMVSGVNPKNNLVEMMELNNHPFMVATQSHPEFKSRLMSPAPLFLGLIQAAKVKKS